MKFHFIIKTIIRNNNVQQQKRLSKKEFQKKQKNYKPGGEIHMSKQSLVHVLRGLLPKEDNQRQVTIHGCINYGLSIVFQLVSVMHYLAGKDKDVRLVGAVLTVFCPSQTRLGYEGQLSKMRCLSESRIF